MVELKNYTLDELTALEVEIKAAKAALRAEAKLETKVAKDARIDKFKGSINEGDEVIFLYGRENIEYTGVAVRVSDKTITVKAEVFAANGKKDTNYVKYDRIVNFTAKAAEAVAEVAEEIAM